MSAQGDEISRSKIELIWRDVMGDVDDLVSRIEVVTSEITPLPGSFSEKGERLISALSTVLQAGARENREAQASLVAAFSRLAADCEHLRVKLDAQSLDHRLRSRRNFWMGLFLGASLASLLFLAVLVLKG
jgi:hypothetical protein